MVKYGLAHSSFSAGVSVFDGALWNSYSSPDLPISGVCATSFDSNGDKWFASPLDGVIHFDDNLFTEYTISDGLVSNYSTAICVDNNDHKWIGSGSGMTQLNASNSTFTKQYFNVFIATTRYFKSRSGNSSRFMGENMDYNLCRLFS